MKRYLVLNVMQISFPRSMNGLSSFLRVRRKVIEIMAQGCFHAHCIVAHGRLKEYASRPSLGDDRHVRLGRYKRTPGYLATYQKYMEETGQNAEHCQSSCTSTGNKLTPPLVTCSHWPKS